MRKLACLLLALAMIFALATTAFADPGDEPYANPPKTIRVTNYKNGETYDLYKLFDLTVNNEDDPSAYAYSVNEDWIDFFVGGAGEQYVTIETVSYFDENDQLQHIYYVTDIEDSAALAKAALKWTDKPAPDDSVTPQGGPAVFPTTPNTTLPNGYWLIGSSVGAIGMAETTPDAAAVTVNEKNPEPTIHKSVLEYREGEAEGTNTEYGQSNDAQIGDEVWFKSFVKITVGARKVVVHDEMTDGLSYVPGSVVIDGLEAGTDYTVSESPTDGCTFEISFNQTFLDTVAAETEYVIEYRAVLNENAVNWTQEGHLLPEKNTTWVGFGNVSTSEIDWTETHTRYFRVFKHAEGETTEHLAGAVFSLKLDGGVVDLVKTGDSSYRVAKPGEEGTVTTFTTVADTDILIEGVDSKTYTLEEITPPNGYNRLNGEITVIVDSANTTRVDVENKTGTELPGTGGIGTTVFYVLGGILVLAAVVLLVTKKRMSAAK